MRNFLRIASGLDTRALLHELASQPELWNQHEVRTSHPLSAHRTVDDILLRYSRFEQGEDFVERVCTDVLPVTYPAWHKLPAAHPFIFGLMTQVKGVHLGRVMVSRVAPGVEIPLHSDRIAPAEETFPDKPRPAEYFERYHVCLQAEPGVEFQCGDEWANMAPGEVWWFNNQLMHRVRNNSAVDRLHLIIDIRTRCDDYLPR